MPSSWFCLTPSHENAHIVKYGSRDVDLISGPNDHVNISRKYLNRYSSCTSTLGRHPNSTNSYIDTTRGQQEGKKKKKKGETSNSSRELQPCALCEVVGHPTNIYYELYELKYIMYASKNLITPNPPKIAKDMPFRNKVLHTNHACAICVEYGNYTHHFPEIPRYRGMPSALVQASINEPLASTNPQVGDGFKTIFYI